MKKSIDKQVLKNWIKHTDSQNRVWEESEMWKQRKLETDPKSPRTDKRDDRRSDRYSDNRHDKHPDLHNDRYCDDKPSDKRRKEASPIRAKDPGKPGYWNKKLIELKEKDPSRWGHSGYKELYPEEFADEASPKKRKTSENSTTESEALKSEPNKGPKRGTESENTGRHKKSRHREEIKGSHEHLRCEISSLRSEKDIAIQSSDKQGNGRSGGGKYQTRDLQSERTRHEKTLKSRDKSPKPKEKHSKEPSKRKIKVSGETEENVDSKKLKTKHEFKSDNEKMAKSSHERSSKREKREGNDDSSKKHRGAKKSPSNIEEKVKSIHDPSSESDSNDKLVSRAAEIREQIKKLSHTVDEKKSQHKSRGTVSDTGSDKDNLEKKVISAKLDAKKHKSNKHKKHKKKRDGNESNPDTEALLIDESKASGDQKSVENSTNEKRSINSKPTISIKKQDSYLSGEKKSTEPKSKSVRDLKSDTKIINIRQKTEKTLQDSSESKDIIEKDPVSENLDLKTISYENNLDSSGREIRTKRSKTANAQKSGETKTNERGIETEPTDQSIIYRNKSSRKDDSGKKKHSKRSHQSLQKSEDCDKSIDSEINGTFETPSGETMKTSSDSKKGRTRLKFKENSRNKSQSSAIDDSDIDHSESDEKGNGSVHIKQKPNLSAVLDDVRDPMDDFPLSVSEEGSEGEILAKKEKKPEKSKKKKMKKKTKKKKKKDKHKRESERRSNEFSLEVSDNFGLCDSVLAFDSLGEIE